MKRILILNILLLMLFSCDPLGDKDLKLGPAPGAEDADFTYTPSEQNDNIIVFSNNADAFMKVWNFGNGTNAKGNQVTGIFPLKGTYEVTLTIYTSGGSITTKQTIIIEETDPTLLDLPVYNMLTGGNDKPGGKTWIIDATRAGHFGVGPNPSDPSVGDYPNYYAAGANEKAGAGLYDDEFTFVLNGFQYEQETNGDVFVNTKYAGDFPGAYSNVGDYTAPYTAPGNLTWSVTEDDEGNQYLNISSSGFIGYYTGVSVYKIVNLSENEMILRAEDAADASLAWYQRLIPKDYVPEEPEPETTVLPVTFESVTPPFTGFGGSNYAAVNNPEAGGINTSAKVGQTEKGAETWAGIATILEDKLDFSLTNTFRVKVYAPKTGTVRLKIESPTDPNTFVEKDATITKTNEWEQLEFDFSGTASDTYGKLALFFDFGSTDQNTFYFDDVELVAPQCDDADEESLSAVPGLNFTMGTATFGQFGNIASEQVANPFPGGINTSCYVNSYQKSGGCETWSGVAYALANAIDFSTATKKKFKMKVYAVNQTTEVTLRLERLPYPDTEPSADRVATITATGEWQELTFDFSDITDPNTYKNMIVYFERNAVCDGDVYYFDDLKQAE